MKKTIMRLAIVAAVLAIVAVVLIFGFLNSIIKKGVQTVGPTLTKTPVTLDSAAVSLLSGKGELKGFVVGNPEGFKTPTAIQAGGVKIAIEPSSITKDKIVIHNIEVIEPQITYEASGLKESNLTKILNNIQGTLPSPTVGTNKTENTGAARKIQVDNFVITKGAIHVSATALGGNALTVPLPEIHLDNLGQGQEGITVGELAQRTLAVILNETAKAVAQNAGKLGIQSVDAAKDIGKGVVDQAKGLKDLFKKK